MPYPRLIIQRNQNIDTAKVIEWSEYHGIDSKNFLVEFNSKLNLILNEKEVPVRFQLNVHGNEIPFICVDEGEEIHIGIDLKALIEENLNSKTQLETVLVYSRALGHDLATPLQKISLDVDLMRMKAPEASRDFSIFLKDIQDSIFSAQNILESLGAFARLKDVENHEICDVNEVLNHVKNVLSVRIKETSATIAHGIFSKLSIPPFDLMVVLQNLLGNSMKYHGRENPRIILLDKITDQYYNIIIQDNGIGIPKQDQVDIFSPYSRGTNVGSVSGKGIGLATCDQIMRSFGGKIILESPVVESQGNVIKGTRMTLCFPKSLLA